jgi:hypothetical protein
MSLPPVCLGALELLGGALGLLFVVCMVCRRLLGVKSSEGAPGGVSSGLCPRCAEGFKIPRDVQPKD